MIKKVFIALAAVTFAISATSCASHGHGEGKACCSTGGACCSTGK